MSYNVEIKYGQKELIRPVYIVKRFVEYKFFFFRKESFTIESDFVKINCLSRKEMNIFVRSLMKVGERVKFDWVYE